jgi:co-chaperonin GroES (HSP10)
VVRLRRLLSDWMLVELEPEKKMTAGGIIVPDTLEEPVRVGRVLMTGPGRRYVDKFVPMPEDIVGQRVAFMIAASQTKQGKQLRTRLSLEDNEEIIRLGDVLVVVEEGVEVSR